tara:strand:- start:306 stop:1697 length:1392 start_codon:yes stop_codon:yes gene_type:complete
MALIDYIDPVARRIHLGVDSMNVSWHPVEIYREIRVLRGSNESLRPYNNFMKGGGNIDKGGGKATERYFTLLEGTRIVPYDANHTIDITGTLITDDGLEGVFCIDKTPLSFGVTVDIQYSPKQVEVINLNFDDLVYSSFQGAVWVDPTSAYSDAGTSNLPNGNTERPVNNIQLATEIAIDRGFSTIRINGNLTLSTGDNVDGFILIGSNPTKTTLTIEDAASTIGTEIKLCTISGILDGNTVLRECVIATINYFNGIVVDCILSQGTITLGGSATALFLRCVSGFTGSSTPIIDMGGSGQSLGMRDYNGGITLTNKTGVDDVSIDMASGHILLSSSITAGTLVLRGLGKLSDLSIGAVVNSDDLINKALLTEITNLVTDLREENPTTQEITKKVWEADLIDFDEEESAGYMLFNTAEVVEQNLVTPEQLATAVWSKDMTAAFALNTSGEILKKIKLIQEILLS